MKVLIINNAEKNVTDYTDPLESILNGIKCDWVTLEYNDRIHEKYTNYDAVILSASPFGDDIVDHHQSYYQWILHYTEPVLGICAGHHIIGRLFGADLIRNQEAEAGECFVIADKADYLFNGLEKRFIVKQNHKDSISLPENFLLLAHSASCKVQIMKHMMRPIYSTQFHAELSNRLLIENFISIVKHRHN